MLESKEDEQPELVRVLEELQTNNSAFRKEVTEIESFLDAVGLRQETEAVKDTTVDSGLLGGIKDCLNTQKYIITDLQKDVTRLRKIA